MTIESFSTVATTYWDKNLRIIPLEPRSKLPVASLKGWPGFVAALPNEKTREEWLSKYATSGVGLLLGSEVTPSFALVALDADDDCFQRMLAGLLIVGGADGSIPVLSGKRGRKGVTLFGISAISDKVKATTLRGAGGLGNIDVLASGRQTAMPPGIHPDTGRPYVFVGTPLLDCEFANLPVITPRTLKILAATIRSEHAITVLSGIATHDAGLAFTAQLVSAGAADAEIEAIVTGLLPESYSGDSLKELPGWIKSARDKGFDQNEEADEESMTALLVRLGCEMDVELFNDDNGVGYASAPTTDRRGVVTLRIKSLEFQRWLRHRAHMKHNKHVTAGPLREAAEAIDMIAICERKSRVVWNRVAGDLNEIEIDLGTPDGRVVRITPDGWTIEPKARGKFVRGSGYAALPDPVGGGDLDRLRTMLHLPEDTFHLLAAFLLNALSPTGPYLILLVEGEQGSGKSFFCQIIKAIMDPNKAPKLRLPDNERDLMIHAKEFRLLNFDNASGMKADISDALCTLATGGGIAVRQLYTDGNLHVMAYTRPFVINGISGFVKRPDLMERAIPIKLEPMPEGMRRTEAEMLAEFENILPLVLGALYTALAGALQSYSTVDPPRHLRMADAARWVLAGEAALGLKPNTLLAAIESAQNELVISRINDDALVIKLRELTAKKPFAGYVGTLFAELDMGRDPTLPRSPSILSSMLDRLRPAMAKAGVLVEFLPRGKRGRPIRITSEAGTDRTAELTSEPPPGSVRPGMSPKF